MRWTARNIPGMGWLRTSWTLLRGRRDHTIQGGYQQSRTRTCTSQPWIMRLNTISIANPRNSPIHLRNATLSAPYRGSSVLWKARAPCENDAIRIA